MNTFKLTTLWIGTSLAQTSLYSNTLIGRQAMHLNVATLHLYLVSVICITTPHVNFTLGPCQNMTVGPPQINASGFLMSCG